MKTFIVKKVKRIVTEQVVKADTAKDAKRLALTDSDAGIFTSRKVSNTVTDCIRLDV